MLTKEEKAKWLERLRDPNSKQCFGSGSDDWQACAHRDLAILPDANMCCIVHGQYAVEGASYIHGKNDYRGWANKHFPEHFDELVRLNDVENKSLAEIADWIEANIPTSD